MKRELCQIIGFFFSLAILSGCDQHSTSERDAQTRIENRNEGLSRRHAREKIARDQAAQEQVLSQSTGAADSHSSLSQTNAWIVQPASLEPALGLIENSSEIQPPAELVNRAARGEVKAQRELAKFYNDLGKFKESSDWYLQAALKGDAEAQRMLGIAYTFGQGVVRDMEQAGKWFLLAAEQGDAFAYYEFGNDRDLHWR